MPERPEVEAARLMLSRHLQGSRVASVNALESGGGPRSGQWDDKVVAVSAPEALASALVGRVLTSVGRRGKQLWLVFSGPGPGLLAHFGMTGSWAVLPPGAKKAAVARYIEVSVEDDARAWPPRFAKLELLMASGARAVFVDPRRFGRVYLEADPPRSAAVAALGVDPIVDWHLMPLARFEAALASRAVPIKSWLLEQGVIAGVGNWIADEALYAARIHPETASSALDAAEAARLHAAIKSICDTAVAVEADNSRLPKEWLFHARWGKGKGPARMVDGAAVSFLTVGGRTSAFVPSRQGKPRKTPAVKRQREEGEEEDDDEEEVKPAASAGAAAAGGGSSSSSAAAAARGGGGSSSSSAAAAASGGGGSSSRSAAAARGGGGASSSAAAAATKGAGGSYSSSATAATRGGGGSSPSSAAAAAGGGGGRAKAAKRSKK